MLVKRKLPGPGCTDLVISTSNNNIRSGLCFCSSFLVILLSSSHMGVLGFIGKFRSSRFSACTVIRVLQLAIDPCKADVFSVYK